MRRSLAVEFTKMNGAGNDFIVIDNRFFRFSDGDLARMATTYCTRRFGIGADGLLALESPNDPHTDFRMRYVNADGSAGSMCGNGARCLALFARNSGIEGEEFRFETDAGVHRARVAQTNDSVKLWFPPPYPSAELSREIITDEHGDVTELFPVWTGTEHAVCFVADLGVVDVEEVGAKIRRASEFAPQGANVDFVQIGHDGDALTSAVIHARTFEKGVETETLACGTGAVAAAVVSARRFAFRAGTIDVRMPGGVLTVGIEREEERITGLYLEGPVKSVYRGSFDFQV